MAYHDTKKNNGISFSIHKFIWTCLGGAFFPDTVYIRNRGAPKTNTCGTMQLHSMLAIFTHSDNWYLTNHFLFFYIWSIGLVLVVEIVFFRSYIPNSVCLSWSHAN